MLKNPCYVYFDVKMNVGRSFWSSDISMGSQTLL